MMTIGIVGSGRIGSTVGRLLARAGHTVMFTFSRDAARLVALADEVGAGARAGSPAEAAAFADVLLFAPPFVETDNALAQLGALDGKVLIDTTNGFTPSGVAFDATSSAAEALAAKVPGARVVKAYNHLHYAAIAQQAHAADPVVAFLAGDDADAKALVARLVQDTGFATHDLGGLAAARHTEPQGPLFNQPMRRADAERAAFGLDAARQDVYPRPFD